MKKTLFRKLLALFLSGTMLTGVGCKDYDDDIDKVNDRIDKLKTGQIATLEQQAAAIQSSIASLEAACEAADTQLRDALEKQAADLAAAKRALESSIAALRSAHDADITRLTGDLNVLSTKVENYNTALKAEIKKVADDLSANYYPKTVIEQKLAALESGFAGQIAGLETKIKACDEAIAAIGKQIDAMHTQIAGKVDKSDYDTFTQATNTAIQKNAAAISVLEALCTGFPEGQTIKAYIDQAKADVVEMLDDYVLKETYEAFMTAYGEFKTDIESRADAAETEIDALKAWQAEMTKEGGTLALLEQRMQEAIDSKTTLDEVKGNFNAECTEFLSGVQGIITQALAEEGIIGAELKSKLEALETKLQEQIDALAARIDALEDQVSDLAGRIQSLVYVPKNMDGTAHFGGIILSAGDKTIRLTTGGKSQMTFLVSPKTLAKKLAAQHNASKDVFSFVPEKITRAAEPRFTIEGDVVGSDDGKITMFVSTDYVYPAETGTPLADAETYAIALRVTSKKAAEEGGPSVDTGIEYTTSFIPTAGNDDNVIENIVLAKKEGEDKFVAIPDAGAAYEMAYNEKTRLTMLAEYVFAYRMGDQIISLEKADTLGNWDVQLDPKPVYTREKWTPAAGITKIVFDPADPMKNAAAKGKLVKITINEGVSANVGKTIRDEVKAAIRAVDGNVNIATNEDRAYSATATIKPVKLDDIACPAAAITWNYGNYTNDRYVVKNIVFDAAGGKRLTKAQYDLLKAAIEADNKWEVTYGDDARTVNAGVRVASVDLPTVNADGDTKFFSYEITGYKGGSGKLAVQKTVALGQAEEVTLKGEITFEGLPALTYTLDMPQAQIAAYEADRLTVIARKDFAKEAVFKMLPAGQTFFANAAEFLAFMRQAAPAAGVMEKNEQTNDKTRAVEAAVRYNGIGMPSGSSDDDRLCVEFMRSYVDFDKAEAYTFTAPEGACYKIADAVFTIAIRGSVTIHKDQGFYLAKGTGVNADGNVIVVGTPNTDQNTFDVKEIRLTNAYNAAYPENADKSQIGLTFELVETTPSPLPTIQNGTDIEKPEAWKMNWNGCGLGEVNVRAQMTYKGVTVASKSFKVMLTNPIEIDKWGEYNVFPTSVPVNEQVTFNVHELLAAKAYGNPKQMIPLDIYGNELVAATDVTEFAKGAYDFDVTFSEASYTSAVGEDVKDFSRFTFDPATGEMTVAASDDLLGGKITARIKATFTYKYSLDANKAYGKKEYTRELTLTFENK